MDGQPAGPGRRRRPAHRSRRGRRAPLLGGGRQPQAAGPGLVVVGRPSSSSSHLQLALADLFLSEIDFCLICPETLTLCFALLLLTEDASCVSNSFI